MTGHVHRDRLNVGTCPEKSAHYRDVFCDVDLVSGRDRRRLVSVEK